jgi:SepF-like predicted cell division protein (DUF552 family)
MSGLLFDLKEGLGKLFKKKEEEPVQQQSVNIRIEKMKSFQDVDRIASLLQEGNIVFLMAQINDVEEYKKSIEKLKQSCTEINGDIVGVGEDNLLIVPKFARIIR